MEIAQAAALASDLREPQLAGSLAAIVLIIFGRQCPDFGKKEAAAAAAAAGGGLLSFNCLLN